MAVGCLWDESRQRQLWRKPTLKLGESAAKTDPERTLRKHAHRYWEIRHAK